MNTKRLYLALFLGVIFVLCISKETFAEESGQPEPAAESEPESEPTAEEDAAGSGNTVGKSSESKAGPNNPAGLPVAFPASVILGMALVAKYIL